MSNLSEGGPLAARRNGRSNDDLRYQDRDYPPRSPESLRRRQSDDKRAFSAIGPDSAHQGAVNGPSSNGSKAEYLNTYASRHSNLSDVDKLRQIKDDIVKHQIPFYKPIPRPQALESISILHNKRNAIPSIHSDHPSDRGRRWDSPPPPRHLHTRSRSPPQNSRPGNSWRGYNANGDTRVISDNREPPDLYIQQRHGQHPSGEHSNVQGLSSTVQTSTTAPGPSPTETSHNLPPRLQRAARHGSASSQQPPLTASPATSNHGVGSFSGPPSAPHSIPETSLGRPLLKNSPPRSDPDSVERQDRDTRQFGDRYHELPPYGRARDYDRANDLRSTTERNSREPLTLNQDSPASRSHERLTDVTPYRPPRPRADSRASLPGDKFPASDFASRLDSPRDQSQFVKASASPQKLDDSRRGLPSQTHPSSLDRGQWSLRTQDDVFPSDRGRQLGRTTANGFSAMSEKEGEYDPRRPIPSRSAGGKDREMPPPVFHGPSSANTLPYERNSPPGNNSSDRSPRSRSLSNRRPSFPRPSSRERRPSDILSERRAFDDTRSDSRIRDLGPYPNDTRGRPDIGYRSSSLPRDNNYPPMPPLMREGHYRPVSPPRNGTYRDPLRPRENSYHPSSPPFSASATRGPFRSSLEHQSPPQDRARDPALRGQPPLHYDRNRDRANGGAGRRDGTRADDAFRSPIPFSGSTERDFARRGSHGRSQSRSNSEDVVMRELSRPPSVQEAPLRRDSSMTRTSRMSVDERSDIDRNHSRRPSLGSGPLPSDSNGYYPSPPPGNYEKRTDDFDNDPIKSSESPAIKSESVEPVVPLTALEEADLRKTPIDQTVAGPTDSQSQKGVTVEPGAKPRLPEAETHQPGLASDDNQPGNAGNSVPPPRLVRNSQDDQRRPSASSGSTVSRGNWAHDRDRDRDWHADRERRYSGPGFGQRPPYDSRPPPPADTRRIILRDERDRPGVPRYPPPSHSDYRGPPRPHSPQEYNRTALRDRMTSPPRSAGYSSRPFYPPAPPLPHLDDRGLKRPRVDDHYPPNLSHDAEFDRRRPPPQAWYGRDEKDRPRDRAERDSYERPPPGAWTGSGGSPRGVDMRGPHYSPSLPPRGRERSRERTGVGMEPFGAYGHRDVDHMPMPMHPQFEHRNGGGYGPPPRWSPPPGGRGREPPYRR